MSGSPSILSFGPREMDCRRRGILKAGEVKHGIRKWHTIQTQISAPFCACVQM
ncbi:hypothetical protein MTR_5g015350 [Medicago truncatula]|uniref:Uncharacterized protein n=1 Tax=Medicago truncatula TaxID=3880 RepID=G7K2H0_MEDTR|nr:hypothetical protein MTR_5g015350 [Medicago truncatula]